MKTKYEGGESMTPDSVDKELLKGTIPLLVLRLIDDRDLYGYQIIKHLRILSGETFFFKEGTLYPILHSLEKSGFITSYWQESSVGRKRKYYRISEVGRQEFEIRRKAWSTFTRAVELVLTSEVPGDDD